MTKRDLVVRITEETGLVQQDVLSVQVEVTRIQQFQVVAARPVHRDVFCPVPQHVLVGGIVQLCLNGFTAALDKV